ncbi:MAG: RibD family protein [Lautropia sp.]
MRSADPAGTPADPGGTPADPAGTPADLDGSGLAAGDLEAAWRLCLAVAAGRRRGAQPAAFLVDGDGRVRGSDDRRHAADTPPRALRRDGEGWRLAGAWSDAAHELIALYRPLLDLAPGQRHALGHLGQSLDGRIATVSGDSCFVNGAEDLTHLHRLRALCDAVIVGAGTVAADDPQLTTRRVPGDDPIRVVIDPSARLTPAHRVCADPRVPTLITRYADDPSLAGGGRCGHAELVAIARGRAGGVDLAALLTTLATRGLAAVLIEGGGITVSRFIASGCLDRLQIAVAPLLIGSGRPGLTLPEVSRLADCPRPQCRRFPMGSDVLWDFDLRAAAPADRDARPPAPSVRP